MRGSFFAMECLTDDDVSIAWPIAAQISASRGHAGVAGEKLCPYYSTWLRTSSLHRTRLGAGLRNGPESFAVRPLGERRRLGGR